MKQLITDECKLVGKTIQTVKSKSEEVALHFTDGTVAVWHGRLGYGEDIYLTLRDHKKLCDYTLMELGVINSEEYKARQVWWMRSRP